MSGEIVVPSVGESINEVVVSRWLVEVGAYVAVDTPVVSLETDKATVEVPAPIQGYLRAIEKGEDDVAEVEPCSDSLRPETRPLMRRPIPPPATGRQRPHPATLPS